MRPLVGLSRGSKWNLAERGWKSGYEFAFCMFIVPTCLITRRYIGISYRMPIGSRWCVFCHGIFSRFENRRWRGGSPTASKKGFCQVPSFKGESGPVSQSISGPGARLGLKE